MPDIPDADDALLDVAAVARRLAVGPITIHRWCRDGRLRCLKPGKAWRIRRADLDGFLQQRHRPQTLTGHLDRFLTVPDQVLTLVEDATLLPQFDAAFFQVGAARNGLLVKVYDPQATSRFAQQAGLERYGLDIDDLEQQGRFRWRPVTSLEGGVVSLQQVVTEQNAAGQPIWAIFDWPGVGDMDAKLHQQEALAALIATHPRLVVSTGVIEPEPESWPPLPQQWHLLRTLQGVIRFARSGLLLSRVVTPVGS